MTPERWRAIEKLFNEVAGRPPEEQAAALASVEPGLRREVEKLLASDGLSIPGVADAVADAGFDVQALLSAHGHAEKSLETPAVEAPAQVLMHVAAGTRLGPYKILDAIGAGGMGEVYRAVDTRLARTVAIKVLPPNWSQHAEMRQRFDREAQTIASLNHPHICVLHDVGRQDGIDFLVMEYLKGETLAARLTRGPLNLKEALNAGIEIADALDKAHRKRVVHRDLKPANVMLTESGTKLLDYGLAKLTPARRSTLVSTAAEGANLADGADLTTPGAIIGTLQYMSPEQLEGTEADDRTDIFAFGALMHEMVTGKKAFEAKSQMLLISAIATATPPPLSAIVPETPKALDHVVETCLKKDPADRWQTARDLLAELRWIAEGRANSVNLAAAAVPLQKRGRLRLVFATMAALLVAAMVVFAVSYFRSLQAADEIRFRVPIQLTAEAGALPIAGVQSGALFSPVSFALSPNGDAIAFVARPNNAEPWSLYLRSVGALIPQKLAGTDDASQPFWSADGRTIGFVARGRLKKVEISGGAPQEIGEAAGFSGGTWNSEGTILFGSALGIQRISADGGRPETITTLDPSESGHLWPQFLPDGHHFLYTAWSGQASNRAIYVGLLRSQDKTRITAAESNAVADADYLVFHRENTVYAQAFDIQKLTLSGQPVRLADDVTFDKANGRGHFAVSQNGVMAYFVNAISDAANTGAQSDLGQWLLTWVNRTGGVLETLGSPGAYRGAEVSPDAKRIAVHKHEGNGGDIWVVEPRGSETRLTFDPIRHNSMPIWSPDRGRIVYAALQKGKWGLYQNLSSGSGSEQLLFESDLPKAPMSWSPDGKRIVFWVRDPKTAGDLWVLPLEGDKKPVPLIATVANETHAQISPDGKWIAYTSDSKDGRNEIYVKPFPSGSGRWQISNNGGDWPRWRADGKELFFHSVGNPASPGVSAGATAFVGPLFSAPVTASGATFEPGRPRDVLIFPVLNLAHSGGDYHAYSVSPDGQRFLYLQYVNAPTASVGQFGPDPPGGLTIALNWTNALKK